MNILDDFRVRLLLGFSIVFIIPPNLAVCLHLWSRLFTPGIRLWWGDWAILTTLVFASLNCGFVIWGTRYGIGQHIQNVPKSDLTMSNIIQLMTFICLFRAVLWVTGGAVTIFWILFVVFPFTHCNPPLKAFYPLLKGTCSGGGVPWYLGSSITNVLLDLITLVLPMPMVWDLQLKLGRKMQLSLIFQIGYSSALVGLARFAVVANDPAVLNDVTDKDLTYNLVPLLLLSIIEAPLGIDALCGLSIRQHLIRGASHGFRSLWSTRGSHRPLLDGSSYAAGTDMGGTHISAVSKKQSGTSFSKAWGGLHKSGTSSVSSSAAKTHEGREDGMPSHLEIPMDRMVVTAGNQV